MMAAASPSSATAIPLERTSPLARPVPAPRFRVLLGGLAVRVAPDVNSSTVTKLEYGRVVQGLPEPSQGFWTAVDVDGQRGWVATQWLLPQGVLAKL